MYSLSFSIAATTITFSFVAPVETGGIKIKAYAVQYKEISQNWEEARNKSWLVGKLFKNYYYDLNITDFKNRFLKIN